MTTLSAVLGVLGAIGTIFGIASAVIAIQNHKQAEEEKIHADAVEEGKVSTHLALIQQSMVNLEKGQTYTTGRVDTIEKTVNEHTAAIAVLTDSNKQAHHRIDEIRDKVNLESCK